MTPYRTLVATVLVVGCAAPVFAQTPAQTEQASAPGSRFQVRKMENVLATAVQDGVDRLGQKVAEVAPGLRLFAGQPHAHGYQLDNAGWFFDVEVPDIYPGSVDLYVDLLPTNQAPGRNVGNPVRPNAVPANPQMLDPMQSAVVRDPRGAYRDAIREALSDAMVDDFLQMPLKPAEKLTIGARRPDPVGPVIAGDESMALILTITGENLALYREGKITRAEAKQRISIKEDRR